MPQVVLSEVFTRAGIVQKGERHAIADCKLCMALRPQPFSEDICTYCFIMTSENLLVLFVSFSCECLILSIYKMNRPVES